MNLAFYNEIDDFLGDKASRYFGTGYINSSQLVTGFILNNSEPERLTFSCVGKVILPESWSVKKSGNQKPHLSTIDIIELSLLGFDHLVHEIYGHHICSIKLVNRLIINAGKVPIESDFDAIDIQGKINKFTKTTNIVDITISNMNVQIYYQNDMNHFIESKVLPISKSALEIKDVMINKEKMKASALVINTRMLKEKIEPWSTSGLFSVGLQLGQILLYQLDSIAREDSNTLWMKKTDINFLSYAPNIDVFHPIYTKLDRVRKYTTEDGEWRRADIYSIIGNTKIICSVTHKLPEIV